MLTLSFSAILSGSLKGLHSQECKTNTVIGNRVRNGKLRDNEDEIFQLKPPHIIEFKHRTPKGTRD